MAQMDMSAALTNPYTLSRFGCIRRVEQVNTFGESVIVGNNIDGLQGVITPINWKLARKPDYQISPKAIQVITKFALRQQSKEPMQAWEPDLVTWHGNQYIVVDVQDFSDYCTGFILALCDVFDNSATPPVTR